MIRTNLSCRPAEFLITYHETAFLGHSGAHLWTFFISMVFTASIRYMLPDADCAFIMVTEKLAVKWYEARVHLVVAQNLYKFTHEINVGCVARNCGAAKYYVHIA